MSRFTLIATRDTTESTIFTIEATSEGHAIQLAHRMLALSTDCMVWEPDDNIPQETAINYRDLKA